MRPLSGSGTPPLTILDDPYGEFCGQHTAYLLENGNLFVFDNGVACVEDPATGATRRPNNVFSRAIEYALDPENGEAVFQRHHSLHGQFEHLGYWGGHIEEMDNGDWLIGWGGNNSWARNGFSLPRFRAHAGPLGHPGGPPHQPGKVLHQVRDGGRGSRHSPNPAEPGRAGPARSSP